MKYFDSIAHTHRKRRREGRSPGQSKVLKQGNKSFLASRWLGFLTKGRRNQSKPPWISPAFRVTACSLERWDEEGQAWDWERDWRSWVEVGVRDGGGQARRIGRGWTRGCPGAPDALVERCGSFAVSGDRRKQPPIHLRSTEHEMEAAQGEGRAEGRRGNGPRLPMRF